MADFAEATPADSVRYPSGPTTNLGVGAVLSGLPHGKPRRFADGLQAFAGCLSFGEIVTAQLPDEPPNYRRSRRGGRLLRVLAADNAVPGRGKKNVDLLT